MARSKTVLRESPRIKSPLTNHKSGWCMYSRDNENNHEACYHIKVATYETANWSVGDDIVCTCECHSKGKKQDDKLRV
jgi:hypothetical protein